MEKPLAAMGLRGAHDQINIALKDRISDWDKIETAMTKTEEGYVYEIRYKDMKKGWPWRVELPVDRNIIQEMADGATKAAEAGGPLGTASSVSPV